MVSNGNVTGIIDRLVTEGLVVRIANAQDRRATVVRLTPKGLRHFARMAEAHEGWVNEILARFSREQSQRADRLARYADGGNTLGSATTMTDFKPKHFNWRMDGSVAVISLARPERKNPLTFDSYAELRDTFRALAAADDVKAVVIASNGGNFSSGGDVHDIIGPLLDRDMKGLLAFTRMTGDLVKAIKACPQPVIAAVDGVCVGAGAMIALFADMRLGTPKPRRRSCSRASASPVATWAPAPCCRA